MPFARLVRSCLSSPSCLLMLVLLSLAPMHASATQNSKPKFRVVALAEHGGIHKPFVDAAKVWLGKLATASNFSIDYIGVTAKSYDAFLSHSHIFVMLNKPS